MKGLLLDMPDCQCLITTPHLYLKGNDILGVLCWALPLFEIIFCICWYLCEFVYLVVYFVLYSVSAPAQNIYASMNSIPMLMALTSRNGERTS